MNSIVKFIVNLVLIITIAVGGVIGNWAVEEFEVEISTELSPAIVDTESLEISSSKGQEMAARIVEEGAILLQNNDNTLPLDYSTVKKVNVFGWRSIDWIYGSVGGNASGCVAPEDDDFSKCVDLYKALKQYGIQYNERLEDMYYEYYEPLHQTANVKSQHIDTNTPLKEPNINDKDYYSDDLLAYSESFSETAIVVIARMAGEDATMRTDSQVKEGPGATNDNTRHYLELSTEEEALLTYVGANYDNVIVILNVANPFECGFLETIEGIDSCLYVGFTGTRAASAIPKLLYGEVSPSGRTVDTFAYDMFTNPANIWAAHMTYTDYNRTYNDFIETIYIGYKWYETADAEGYWSEVSNQYGTGFDGVVQFPFGYGLSYNTYSWEVGEIYTTTLADETPVPYNPTGTNEISHMNFINIPVTVTNNGQYPGRDVVEVYVNVPYTKGGIEKVAVSLVGYGKTNILQPGAQETIIVTVDVNDFTSYDCYDKNGNDHKGYELEEGVYTVSLRTDSHNVKMVGATGAETAANYTFDVSETIKITKDKYTDQPVGNLFTGEDAVDTTSIDAAEEGFDPGIKWLTRESFMTLEEISAARVARACTPSAKINPSDASYSLAQAKEWDNATVDAFGNTVVNNSVTWGADNGLMLAENGIITELGRKLGADYNAEEWGAVLDQLTIDEVVKLASGYYGSKAVESVGKPFLYDYDGPAQIKSFRAGPRGTGYPTMVVLSSSWNQKLAYEFGQSYGDDMKAIGVSGVWGWAMDNHRTSFFGRNHESPSEDAVLAGYTVMNAVQGLHTRGRYCFLKHFAVYDHGRNGPKSTYWLTEQALRENQLKAYYKPIVIGGALGIMTTYRGLGAENSETTTALLTGVLRNEWQFKGAITTDYTGIAGNCEDLIRAGGNFGMGSSLSPAAYNGYDSTASLRFQNRLRESAHEILYMWLRADYYEQEYLKNPSENDTFISSTSIQSWEWWRPAMTGINAFLVISLSLWTTFAVIDLFDPRKRY